MRLDTIGDKLQDLIAKSDTIVTLLQGQLAMMEERKTRVGGNLVATFGERGQAVADLEAVRAEIQTMNPEVIRLEIQIAAQTDAGNRTRIETDLAQRNARHNELVRQEQVLLAKSQTRARDIDSGKTWIDALQN